MRDGINRRELRRQLGSRSIRRRGTKTKARPEAHVGKSGVVDKFRFPRRQKVRVSVTVEAMVRKLAAAKRAAAQVAQPAS